MSVDTRSSMPPRRFSSNFSTNDTEAMRKTSLKEMPSFRDEACRALNRRDDISSIKSRLSFNRDLLHADPSSKPWLRKMSTPVEARTGLNDEAVLVYERKASAGGSSQHRSPYHVYTATPAQIIDEVEDAFKLRHSNSVGSSEGSSYEY